MASTQDLQAPLDLAIVLGVLNDLPENWQAFRLEVAGDASRVPGALSFCVSSPEGLPAVGLDPESDVFAKAMELDELFQKQGAVFSSIVYTAEAVGTDWRWKASYSYHRQSNG